MCINSWDVDGAGHGVSDSDPPEGSIPNGQAKKLAVVVGLASLLVNTKLKIARNLNSYSFIVFKLQHLGIAVKPCQTQPINTGVFLRIRH